MQTATIGFIREDGDLAVIATLNNNDGHIGAANFIALVERLRQSLQAALDEPLQVFERQDAPDYVEI